VELIFTNFGLNSLQKSASDQKKVISSSKYQMMTKLRKFSNTSPLKWHSIPETPLLH